MDSTQTQPQSGLVGGPPAPSLTPRECEVIALLAEGKTAGAMARQLRISVGTVRKHLEHIYAKVGGHDRMIVVRRAQRSGLLPADN